MESGRKFSGVLIVGIAAGTVFNIQVASQLTSMEVSSEIGGLLAVGMAREMAPLLTATLMTRDLPPLMLLN